MTTNNIDICGITLQCNLPKCYCNYPCKEICKTDKFCVPDCKPDIENILQLFIDTSIKKCNILNTPMGRKLVIYGNIHMKILYVANTSCQSVHAAHFDTPFCTFIMIGTICRKITDICLFVEDAFITQLDTKNFSVSTIMLVYPILEKKDNNFDYEYNCNENSYISNINSPNFNYNKNSTIEPDSLNNMDENTNNDFNIEYNTTENKANYNSNFESNLEFDIEYDMNENNNDDIPYSTDHDLNCDDLLDLTSIQENEDFKNHCK